MAELSVIGISHRTAGVVLRERLALPSDAVTRLLSALRVENVFSESLVLATCNRTECYFVPHRPCDAVAYFVDHVAKVKGGTPVTETAAFYRYDDLEAVRHLFRVAASLDSQIVGEHQILGQVKDAYRRAVEARSAGFLLNKLLHWAFRVGKRVQTETGLGRGSASVAAAAVELAEHLFSSLADKTVLVVGAGETAESAARALLRSGASRLIVANRTVERARQLADDLLRAPPAGKCAPEDDSAGDVAEATSCPALVAEATAEAGAPPADTPVADFHRPATEAVGLDDLPAAVALADLVIASTGAAQPVLTYDSLAGTLRRRSRSILIIDIAVPRDVDERLGRLDNVFLYNIDDLDRLVAANLEKRRQEIPRAEAIVELEVEQFGRWLASREVAPTIRLLQERLATIQRAHLERHGRRFSDADREQLERFCQALVSQILHKPLAMLKSLSVEGTTSERLATIDMLRRLFDLDSPDEQS